jgi:uncharacterized protein involved in exopolysaccharide biosynthesis
MEEDLNFDLRKFISVVWKEKILVILVTFLTVCLGIFYAFMVQEEFQTNGKILPELQSKGSAGLSQFAGLASLAGVDLASIGGSSIDAVRPDLYPNVINSTPFYLELLKHEVVTRENKKMTFEQFYHEVIEKGEAPDEKLTEKYPVKDSSLIIIDRLNEIRLRNLRERISASLDKKSGVITIVSKMPDPVVAASTTNFAMTYLMKYVTDYRTEKLRADVAYLGSQVAASRGKYFSTQEKKAKYTDQFQDMQLQIADIQRERLESEYRISSTFYNELLKKYEEAKFKLHQETPVFKVLEPPVTPVKKLKPKRAVIAFMFMVFGFGLGCLAAMKRNNNYKDILGIS